MNDVQLGRAMKHLLRGSGAVVLMAAGLLTSSCSDGSFDNTTGRAGGPTPPPGVAVPPRGMETPAPIPPPPVASPPGGRNTPPPASPGPGAPTPPVATPPPTPTPPPFVNPPGATTPTGVDPNTGMRPVPKVASLVLGNANVLDDTDLELLQILEEKGFFVFRTDDADQPEPDVTLVVISPSVAPATVAIKYRNVLAPVLVMEVGVFDDMQMTGRGEQMAFGTTAGRQIAIAADQQTHPLAAGLSGTVAVSTGNSPLNWGVPSAAAVVAATLVNTPQRAAIFGYTAGATMQGLAAPAKRLGFFAGATDTLTPDGERLFQAAVDWLLAP
jgi:hypothetical protein